MGNKFGNFENAEAAKADLIARGFEDRGNGVFAKPGMSGGNLFEAPRKVAGLVKICSYRVDGKYAADGLGYHVFQHHFL